MGFWCWLVISIDFEDGEGFKISPKKVFFPRWRERQSMMRMKELLEPPKYTLVLWLILFLVKKSKAYVDE